MKIATLSALIALAVACAPPTAATVRVESDAPWTAAGDRLCVVPDSDPPCAATPVSAPSRIGVWSTGRVIPLEQELAATLVPGLCNEDILRCDLSRFPMPETCVVPTTCEGVDVVVMSGYVRRIAMEFVRLGRCW